MANGRAVPAVDARAADAPEPIRFPSPSLSQPALSCGVVKPNRSIPGSVVIPVLIYPDVREAVRWLGESFGFVERVRIGE